MRFVLLTLLGVCLAQPVVASEKRLCSDSAEAIETMLAEEGEHLMLRFDETIQKQRKFVYVNPQTQHWTMVVFPLEATQNIELPTARVAEYSYCIVQSGDNFVQLQPNGE